MKLPARDASGMGARWSVRRRVLSRQASLPLRGAGAGDGFTLAWVNGRAGAGALVAKWAGEIKEHDRPLS